MNDTPLTETRRHRAHAGLDPERMLSQRTRAMGTSGIRKIFELAAKLEDPLDFSIGQPDFPVPDAMKRAAIDAIEHDHNGYTLTGGIPPLRRRITQHLARDLGWPDDLHADGGEAGLLVTSGTSGGLQNAMMALLSPGDEVIMGDPFFVAYPPVVKLAGGVPIICDTYPDFRLTAERIEPLITTRTKAVLLNSPGNPSGVVLSSRECADILELCRSRGILLISDEIYDEFTFADAREPAGLPNNNVPRCPSPARADGAWNDVLLIRGFGKTYGCTGWRMGYVAGPQWLMGEIAKMQQYTFVCAPHPFQRACVDVYDLDVSDVVERFQRRRDLVAQKLAPHADVTVPGGAFYFFLEVPGRLGMTATEFCAKAVEEKVVAIPGGVFSERDTHFRLSFAARQDKLERGLDILARLMSG